MKLAKTVEDARAAVGSAIGRIEPNGAIVLEIDGEATLVGARAIEWRFDADDMRDDSVWVRQLDLPGSELDLRSSSRGGTRDTRIFRSRRELSLSL